MGWDVLEQLHLDRGVFGTSLVWLDGAARARIVECLADLVRTVVPKLHVKEGMNILHSYLIREYSALVLQTFICHNVVSMPYELYGIISSAFFRPISFVTCGCHDLASKWQCSCDVILALQSRRSSWAMMELELLYHMFHCLQEDFSYSFDFLEPSLFFGS